MRTSTSVARGSTPSTSKMCVTLSCGSQTLWQNTRAAATTPSSGRTVKCACSVTVDIRWAITCWPHSTTQHQWLSSTTTEPTSRHATQLNAHLVYWRWGSAASIEPEDSSSHRHLPVPKSSPRVPFFTTSVLIRLCRHQRKTTRSLVRQTRLMTPLTLSAETQLVPDCVSNSSPKDLRKNADRLPNHRLFITYVN